MEQQPVISIVSPVFQSADILPVLVERILATFAARHIEILLVDDGCTDTSWAVICALADKHPQLRGIRLDKNYGQHTAIFAGLHFCRAESIVVMDCDLQDLPELIPVLIDALKPEVDAVFAYREKRYNTYMRRQFSNWFYFVLSKLTGTKLDASVANFGVYKKSLVDEILRKPPHFFYLPLAIRKKTKSTVKCSVPHAERYSGTSTYSVKRLIALAFRVFIAQCFCAPLLIRSNTTYKVAADTSAAGQS